MVSLLIGTLALSLRLTLVLQQPTGNTGIVKRSKHASSIAEGEPARQAKRRRI